MTTITDLIAEARASGCTHAPLPIEEVERLMAERDAALETAGKIRMCVNCGRYADAVKVKPGDDLPGCRGEDGWSACTFDVTPEEAWLHWRKEAHDLRAEVKRLAGLVMKHWKGNCFGGVDHADAREIRAALASHIKAEAPQ